MKTRDGALIIVIGLAATQISSAFTPSLGTTRPLATLRYNVPRPGPKVPTLRVRGRLSEMVCRSKLGTNVDASEVSIGAEEHWKTFAEWPGGDFLGNFCRWDPISCETIVNLKLLRSYHWQETEADTFLKQTNKIFFEDERGEVSRGPWHVRKSHATEKGLIHERVEEENPATFVCNLSPGRSNCWFPHQIEKLLSNPGVIPLGNDGPGYMFEFIIQQDTHVRSSVGMVYDALGSLKWLTVNREDDREYPSKFWSPNADMVPLSPNDIESALNLGDANNLLGYGSKSEFSPEGLLRQRITVDWRQHLTTLSAPNLAVRKGPDGFILLTPLSIQDLSSEDSGQPWSVAVLWQPENSSKLFSWELRYRASGAFDCFRSVCFDGVAEARPQ
mmetsp:Transcript_9426/g.18833  ORF Transcript_9426/g.18833 Transcript_9426/m.18833 type:complete len:388 (-) Transcript_9426:226-1389(-)|eukprot:CAMPEP_0181293114 /NCGR_PEP_ID=MMETSP1101-20121128/2888_1 /TAXON_ID=46948 /ORGANISM="Rhodomonas abbreviata, Strain Caron Lab Isolate" /LENGTH=387 /DNA_ID=CAMNT_0023397671 /DNA_START=138 /DNA_END=1301 /DNA_ORIENTATION=-